jgi:hypothetical protein
VALSMRSSAVSVASSAACIRSVRQHTSAYVSIRQHTSAHLQREILSRLLLRCQYLYFCTSTASNVRGSTKSSTRLCIHGAAAQRADRRIHVVTAGCRRQEHLPYVSIRQHTSAYVSIRQHTSAYVSIRQAVAPTATPATRTSAHVSTRQHTSAHVSTRQHTPAYASIRPRRQNAPGNPTRSTLADTFPPPPRR